MSENLTRHPVWELIDGILVVNLDTSTERMETFREVNALKLPWEKVSRLSAVLGRALPTYGQRPWFTESTGERARFWGGTAGCALSHRKAIEQAKAEGWRNVLILEDDAHVTSGKKELDFLQDLLQNLGGKYMLYLGYNRPEPYGRIVAKGDEVKMILCKGRLQHGSVILGILGLVARGDADFSARLLRRQLEKRNPEPNLSGGSCGIEGVDHAAQNLLAHAATVIGNRETQRFLGFLENDFDQRCPRLNRILGDIKDVE